MTVITPSVDTPPFILTSPQFAIGPEGGPLQDIKCSLNQISCGVDQDSNDYDTFCGSYRAYGVPRFTITLTVFQNFDPTGPWAILYPLAGTLADFELLPDGTVTQSATNPLMFGKVRVPYMPFLDAAVNEASSIDIELSVQGIPSFAPPDTAPASAQASSTSASTSSASTSTP